MSIGKRLKKTREEKNISLRVVQDNLKIRTRYLEALENDNFDVIPGEAYVRAFIKSYANFLGIDHQELLSEYQKLKDEENQLLEEMDGKGTESSFRTRNKTLLSSIIILILIIIIAFLAYYIFNIRTNEIGLQSNSNLSNNTVDIFTDREDNNITENNHFDISVIEDNIGDIEEKIFDTEEEVLFEEDTKEYKEVEVIVTEESWLQLLVDGENVFEGTLYKGDSRNYKYKNNISLKIGNAAGIQVKKDNELYGPWGERSEVVKKEIQ